jgi:hypothetical protein
MRPSLKLRIRLWRILWHGLNITSKELSSATLTTPVLFILSHVLPRTKTVAASAVRIDKGTLETWHSIASVQFSSTPGRDLSTKGNGECEAVINERADCKQLEALVTVLYGGLTNEGEPIGGCIR